MLKSIRIRQFSGWLVAILLIVSSSLPYGCSTGESSGLSEGKIVYEVSFEDANMNPMMKALLPSEVTTYFKNNRTCTVISMGMNMMETRLISDAASFTYTTLMDAMGKKIALVLNKAQVEENYSDRVDLKVMHTGETKVIAGIECKQAMITDSTNNTYPVYYTEKLNVKNPNWSSPYRDIKGCMMEYSIRFGEMVMNLKAKEVTGVENDESLFTIPEGYQIVKDTKDLKLDL